jgi:hypothetical protein
MLKNYASSGVVRNKVAIFQVEGNDGKKDNTFDGNCAKRGLSLQDRSG